MLAVVSGIDVLEPHLVSGLDDQQVAIVHVAILQRLSATDSAVEIFTSRLQHS
jgi:hypothetical protein